MRKKIALVAVNSRTSHTNLALYYIKKILKNIQKADCHLIELTINENWKNSLEKVTDQQFDYYLFSVYIWNSEYIEQLVSMIKQLHPSAKVILGGPEITYNHQKWKFLKIADTLVVGQAETFITELFDNKLDVHHSEKTPIDKVPFPYEEEDYKNLTGRLVYYEASRGCLFNCTYCLSSCSDQKLEYRDINKVKEELKTLISIKPKIIKMVDRTFNSQREYAREIWNFLIQLKSPIPFHFEIHPLFLEEEDFEILKSAPENLFHFEVGIQSTNKDILYAVDRPFNWEKERGNIRKLCLLKNIHTHLDQIVALPLDTPFTAIESFNDILSLYPDEFQLGFLKILPGTSLAHQVETYEMVVNSKPPYEVIQTATMNFTEMKEFYNLETDLGRFYNNHYFKHTMSYLLKKSTSPWEFFSYLQEFSPQDRSVKRWAVLGESLYEYAKKYHNDEIEYIFDLLRLDWCPFASAQNFPPFLQRDDNESIKEKRKEVYPYCSENIDGFTRRDFNHSLLFIPQSDRLLKELKGKAILFYRTDKVAQFLIDLP
ncbi:MAG: DUF4080 domain-containing protein [Spirochaetaceae bacterium]|nr:DUF4080 domain-containing protein [Spirochaetaceae bacterium]